MLFLEKTFQPNSQGNLYKVIVETRQGCETAVKEISAIRALIDAAKNEHQLLGREHWCRVCDALARIDSLEK